MDDLLREVEQMTSGEPKYEKISFYDEEQDGFAEFFVMERTRLNGTEYLLATQELNQDSDGYVFKVVSEHREDDDEVTLELARLRSCARPHVPGAGRRRLHIRPDST